MSKNLYQKLKELIDRQRELNRIGGWIKHDKNKKVEFEKFVAEYKENDALIEQIRRNCFISPLKLAKIISEQENDEFKLKIFRERDEDYESKTSYFTGRFIACYLNSKNEFFNSNEGPRTYKSLFGQEEYINNELPCDRFEELIQSFKDNTNFIILTSNQVLPTLAPSSYLENVNFIDLLVYGRVADIIRQQFQTTAEKYVERYLEQINADEILLKQDAQEEKTL